MHNLVRKGAWLPGPSLPAIETGNLGEPFPVARGPKGFANGGSSLVRLLIAVPGEPGAH